MPGVWQLPMKYIHFYRIGSEKKNSVPLPGSVMNPILPSWASTIFLTMSRLKAGAALFLRGRLDRCCPEGLEEFVLFRRLRGISLSAASTFLQFAPSSISARILANSASTVMKASISAGSNCLPLPSLMIAQLFSWVKAAL